MKLCNQMSKARTFWFQTKRFLKVFPILVYIKQDGDHGSHLGFPIGTILAIFDLQVIPMLPTKLKVNKPFDSGEEAKNRFSRWASWQTSWISHQKDFSYFDLCQPDASYQVSSQLAFSV